VTDQIIRNSGRPNRRSESNSDEEKDSEDSCESDLSEWMKRHNMISVYDQLLQNHFNFITTVYAMLLSA
jgi:hypothetical protein